MKRKSLLFLLLFALLAPWAANAQTSLFSEDFEDGTMPTSWTTEGSGSWSVGTGDYSASTGAGHGTYNAKITHGSTGNVTKLITPEMDLSSVTTAELSFMYVMRSWAGDTDELRVYYRTSTDGTWTKIAEYTDAVNSWTNVESLPLLTLSNTYQIAFEFTDKYGYGVGIDYINIEQGAATPKPTNLAVSNVTDNSATLSWNENGTATAWQICLNNDETNLIDATENPYTLNNLNTGGDMAGLVNMGCDYWQFKDVAISGLTVSGTAASSLGMLVNRAWTDSSHAMYLELPTGYTYTIQNIANSGGTEINFNCKHI